MGRLPHDDVQELQQDALGYFFGCGAVIVSLSNAFDGRAHPAAAWFVVGAAGTVSLLTLVTQRRAPLWLMQCLLAIGSVMITLVAWTSGRPQSTDLVLYAWVAMYTGFFFSSRWMVGQAIWSGLCYAVLLTWFNHIGGVRIAGQAITMAVTACLVAGQATAMLRTALEVLFHRIRIQAGRDNLTRTYNRSEFARRGQAFMAKGVRPTLIRFDIRDFQAINDRIGTEQGDQVLCELALRLRGELPDLPVARIDGDEFAVLAVDDQQVAQAQTLLAAFSTDPLLLGNDQVSLAIAIGVAVAYPEDDFDKLMRDADLALQDARSAAAGTTARLTSRTYTLQMRAKQLDRQLLSDELHRAVERGELQLHFQPLIDLETGTIRGAEALLRWYHPTRGPVSPAQFIPLAEDSGAIVAIGEWVLDQSLRAAARWPSLTTSPPLISINLSPRQLAEPTVVQTVIRAAQAHGVNPSRVMLEVTETSVMADVVLAQQRLAELRGHGFRIAIDDFGTGHSSLAYLRDLPVTELKVAREFVCDLPGSSGSLGLVTSIVGLAHNLGLTVVAEGIETTAQADCLRDLGAELGQGFLMHRPMPLGDLEVVIQRGTTPTIRPTAQSRAQ